MPIAFACECGRFLRVKDELANRRVRCPHCGQPVSVPRHSAPPIAQPSPNADVGEPSSGYVLAAEPGPPLPPPSVSPTTAREEALDREYRKARKAAYDRYREALRNRPETSWLEYVYWVLLIPLIPLAFSLFQKDDDSIEQRLIRTLEQAPPEVRERIERSLHAPEDREEDETLIDLLPGRRIQGAHLARTSYVHWVYAFISAGLFFVVVLMLFPDDYGKPLQLVACGLFTGTIGIFLLLVAQLLSIWTYRIITFTRNPLFLLFFWIAWAIGFSYRAAVDPSIGFLGSMLGFTFGVGFCEEVCKALPLLWHFRRTASLTWRSACNWGFASGVGFGVAEGVIYSGDYYNGVGTWMIYLVRFSSCVALHAIWGASVALFMHKYQKLIQGQFDGWFDIVPRMLVIVSGPMFMHGLYDTFLKMEWNAAALAMALISFAWLVYRIENARRHEFEGPVQRMRAGLTPH